MKQVTKKAVVKSLRSLVEGAHCYIVNTEGLKANQLHHFRSMLRKEKIQCKLVPNALLRWLFKENRLAPLSQVLSGSSTLLITKGNPSEPAKIIKRFKAKEPQNLPALKGAWVYEMDFLGPDHLVDLARLKSKELLIAEILLLLQGQALGYFELLHSAQNSVTHLLTRLPKTA